MSGMVPIAHGRPWGILMAQGHRTILVTCEGHHTSPMVIVRGVFRYIFLLTLSSVSL